MIRPFRCSRSDGRHGAAQQDTDAARIHVAEQLCFSHIRVGIMDEGDFPGGNALCHEILLHVVIHGERAGCGNDCIHIDDAESIVLNIFLFRRFPDKSAVHIDKRPGFQLLPCRVRGCLGRSSPAFPPLGVDKSQKTSCVPLSAAVSRQMAWMRSTAALIFEPAKSSASGSISR